MLATKWDSKRAEKVWLELSQALTAVVIALVLATRKDKRKTVTVDKDLNLYCTPATLSKWDSPSVCLLSQVICPSHLCAQWTEEFEASAPGSKIAIITTMKQFNSYSFEQMCKKGQPMLLLFFTLLDAVIVSSQFLQNPQYSISVFGVSQKERMCGKELCMRNT